MSDRIAILIDGQANFATTKALGLDIDYKQLLPAMEKHGRLLRAIYYTVEVMRQDEHKPARPLLDWLEYNGFTVVSKEVLRTETVREPGSIQVEFTCGALELAQYVQHLFLFTCNEAYWPLIEALQRRGCRVTVVSSIKCAAASCPDILRRQADTFIELDDLRAAIARPARDAA